MIGFFDDYDTWLNGHLETEEPLSDIILELSCSQSDINKTVSVLHNYCNGKTFDEIELCNRIRLFFKNAYNLNKMSKEQITKHMYRISLNIAESCDFELNTTLWRSMFYLYDYYSLAKQGIISWNNFDVAFFSYLNNGIPLNDEIIWKSSNLKKPSLIKRIKNLFIKK